MLFWLHLLADIVLVPCVENSTPLLFITRFALSDLPTIPVIEGQAHREAIGSKILPTYPMEGCPLRREYRIVEGRRKRQIL